MSKARLVITAVVVEGRSQSEVARCHRVSQPWVSRLVARYRAQGQDAFEPRSRRPPPFTVGDRPRDRGPGGPAAQGAGGPGPGRRPTHHLLARRTPPQRAAVTGHGVTNRSHVFPADTAYKRFQDALGEPISARPRLPRMWTEAQVSGTIQVSGGRGIRTHGSRWVPGATIFKHAHETGL